MAYNKTTWTNDVTALNKTNMDNIENGIEKSHKGTHIYGESSAGSDTYVISFSPAFTAYNTGMVINFKADVSNTGSATVNVDTLGAKTLKKMTAAGKANLDTGDIIANGIYFAIYDGTDLILCCPTAIMASLFTARGMFIRSSAANTPEAVAIGTSGKALMSDGSDIVYGYSDTVNYVASNNAILTSNAEWSGGGSANSWYTAKSFTVKSAGTVRVKYDFKTSAQTTELGIDGVVKDTTMSTNYYTSYFDLSVLPGVTYNIQIRQPSYNSVTSYVRNVTICADANLNTNSIT